MKLNTKNLQLARIKSGLTSKEIAARYGCTVTRINALMKKESVYPDTVGKLARALNVDPEEIILQEN